MSQLHQCNQGMLPNVCFLESSLRSFFSYYLCSEDLFGYIPGISTTNVPTKELPRDGYVRSKKQQTSPERLVYRLSEGDTNLTKEGSFSTTLCSNCKHSLNLTCHAHKRNATEVTKIYWRFPWWPLLTLLDIPVVHWLRVKHLSCRMNGQIDGVKARFHNNKSVQLPHSFYTPIEIVNTLCENTAVKRQAFASLEPRFPFWTWSLIALEIFSKTVRQNLEWKAFARVVLIAM